MKRAPQGMKWDRREEISLELPLTQMLIVLSRAVIRYWSQLPGHPIINIIICSFIPPVPQALIMPTTMVSPILAPPNASFRMAGWAGWVVWCWCFIAFIRRLAMPVCCLRRGCSTGSTRRLFFGSLERAWNVKSFSMNVSSLVEWRWWRCQLVFCVWVCTLATFQICSKELFDSTRYLLVVAVQSSKSRPTLVYLPSNHLYTHIEVSW